MLFEILGIKISVSLNAKTLLLQPKLFKQQISVTADRSMH